MKTKTKLAIFCACGAVLAPYYDEPITITLPSVKQVIEFTGSIIIDVANSLKETSAINGVPNDQNCSSAYLTNVSELTLTESCLSSDSTPIIERWAIGTTE